MRVRTWSTIFKCWKSVVLLFQLNYIQRYSSRLTKNDFFLFVSPYCPLFQLLFELTVLFTTNIINNCERHRDGHEIHKLHTQAMSVVASYYIYKEWTEIRPLRICKTIASVHFQKIFWEQSDGVFTLTETDQYRD